MTEIEELKLKIKTQEVIIAEQNKKIMRLKPLADNIKELEDRYIDSQFKWSSALDKAESKYQSLQGLYRQRNQEVKHLKEEIYRVTKTNEILSTELYKVTKKHFPFIY